MTDQNIQINDENRKKLYLAINETNFTAFMKAHHFRDKPTFSFWLQQTAILDKYDWVNQSRWIKHYPRWQAAVNKASLKDVNDDTTINYFSGRWTDAEFEAKVAVMEKKDYVLPQIPHQKELEDDGFLVEMCKQDWDYFSESEKFRFIDIIKKKNVAFFKDRRKLYKGLLGNGVGTIYAYLNNVNAYFSIISAPIEPGEETESTENYYYDFTIPRSYAVIYWYDNAKNLNTGAAAQWYTRVRVPNVALDTSLWARNTEEKVKNLFGENKYYIAGFFFILAAIPAIITHI